MTIFILMAISFLLLLVPLEFIALYWHEVGSLKFFINLITHQLGHGGLMHLLGNYMFMIPYAVFLEAKLGPKKFLGFYFLTGLLAAFSQVLGAEPAGLIGSSGAAFGVFAGACALFDKNIYQRISAFFLMGLAVMVQFYLATHDFFGGVAYWAHFGGALGGLALVHFFVKPYMLHQSKSERK